VASIIFREKVFAMLKNHNRISDAFIDKMRSWRHSGFSVHTDVSIHKNDNQALLNLAHYIIHPSFSSHKINYIEKTDSIIYTSSFHPGKKRNFEILPVIEFLHRICLHIPNPYESLIRYYGYKLLRYCNTSIFGPFTILKKHHLTLALLLFLSLISLVILFLLSRN